MRLTPGGNRVRDLVLGSPMRNLRKPNLPHVSPRARALTLQTAQRARRAGWELLIVGPLFGLILVAYLKREEIFGTDKPVRVTAAFLMVGLGWRLARDFGRFSAPALFRRMDPATAGTVGFLIRLVFLIVATVIALRVAGLKPQTLALGGAITAVIFGLAAQQTLGNLIAGLVLISARPFKVGDRVRLQAGNLAGQLEGVVASLGLLYTTFAQGQDAIMVPNSTVLSSAVVPLREPAAVDLRARLRPDVKPSMIQSLLEEAIQTPVRGEPSISLEEVDSDEVVVRIQATPLSDADGPRLADEVLAAVASVTDSHGPADPPRAAGGVEPGDGAGHHDGAALADGEIAARRGAPADRGARLADPSTQEYES
jgi:small conductance mechanosensitive channel